jgi:terminase small subunit / prophage DNA-packing protein
VLIDLNQPLTQAAFGELVGMSQQAVSDLQARGVIEAQAPAHTWLLAYCEHLRLTAAGRDPDGELSTERARVARAQAERLERANSVARGEVAPVSVLELVLADVARQIATRLEALVPTIKRRMPDLPATTIAHLTSEISACRDLCASCNLRDADRIDSETEDEDATTGAPAAEATA